MNVYLWCVCVMSVVCFIIVLLWTSSLSINIYICCGNYRIFRQGMHHILQRNLQTVELYRSEFDSFLGG